MADSASSSVRNTHTWLTGQPCCRGRRRRCRAGGAHAPTHTHTLHLRVARASASGPRTTGPTTTRRERGGGCRGSSDTENGIGELSAKRTEAAHEESDGAHRHTRMGESGSAGDRWIDRYLIFLFIVFRSLSVQNTE